MVQMFKPTLWRSLVKTSLPLYVPLIETDWAAVLCLAEASVLGMLLLAASASKRQVAANM